MTLERASFRAALLVAAVGAGGCYTYVPMEHARVGAPVRMDVSVSSSVGGSARQPELVTFEGTIVGFGDTLFLETRDRQPVGAHGQFTMTDTIRIGSSAFSSLEERVLSKPRTALLTVALIGGAALAFTAIKSAAGGGDGGDKPGNGTGTQGSVIVQPGPAGWRLFGIRIPLSWPPG